MKQFVKFPCGLSNLEKIIKEGYVFIDKTPYLKLLEENESNVSYLRPRRIGKSLFISMLEYYYDTKHKNKFETLFGNTYIGQNPTPLANSFRVLKFDFSGIDTRTQASAERGFLKKIAVSLESFMRDNTLFDAEARKKILIEDVPAQMMNAFLGEYSAEAIPIYLLIDEYDHFTNEILWRDLASFKTSVSQDGYVRKFYENIKTATQQGTINRFFITGVSPLTLDSLTSGFNIVKHLTHSLMFHDMMGFTEAEVGKLLDLALEDTNRRQVILNDIKMWYNGYKFNLDTQSTVYNANMTLYFLDEFKKQQKYPYLMLDPNVMPDYGKLQAMFEVANYEDNLEVLQHILDKGEIEDEQIYQFDFNKRFDRTSFVNFLYYLGNLTIKEQNDLGNAVIFKIPNQVIKELYWRYYAHILEKRADFEYQDDGIKESLFAAARGNIAPFLHLVEETLQILSNRDFQRFDEKYVKMLIIAYASRGNMFYVVSERETTARGYTDVELHIRPNNTKTHAQYLFEIKYIKKENEKNFDTVKAAAIKQLQHYLATDTLIQSKRALQAYVIIFVNDALYWERVER